MRFTADTIPFLRRNTLPEYDEHLGLRDNQERFMEWAIDLRRPIHQIPEIAQQHGYSASRHPLGFTAVYLTARDHGQRELSIGQVRANIYPEGEIIEDDIHTHGFDFLSGVVQGKLHNTMHAIDFTNLSPQENGYFAYETRINEFGDNETVLINSVPMHYPIQSVTTVLQPGDTYTMRRREDFHSVAAESAITIFCKTPTLPGRNGTALFLRKPERPEPPASY